MPPVLAILARPIQRRSRENGPLCYNHPSVIQLSHGLGAGAPRTWMLLARLGAPRTVGHSHFLHIHFFCHRLNQAHEIVV